jgi:hypothetical protein
MSKFDKIRERLKKFTSERRGGKGFVAKSPSKKDKQTTKKDKDDKEQKTDQPKKEEKKEVNLNVGVGTGGRQTSDFIEDLKDAYKTGLFTGGTKTKAFMDKYNLDPSDIVKLRVGIDQGLGTRMGGQGGNVLTDIVDDLRQEGILATSGPGAEFLKQRASEIYEPGMKKSNMFLPFEDPQNIFEKGANFATQYNPFLNIVSGIFGSSPAQQATFFGNLKGLEGKELDNFAAAVANDRNLYNQMMSTPEMQDYQVEKFRTDTIKEAMDKRQGQGDPDPISGTQPGEDDDEGTSTTDPGSQPFATPTQNLFTFFDPTIGRYRSGTYDEYLKYVTAKDGGIIQLSQGGDNEDPIAENKKVNLRNILAFIRENKDLKKELENMTTETKDQESVKKESQRLLDEEDKTLADMLKQRFSDLEGITGLTVSSPTKTAEEDQPAKDFLNIDIPSDAGPVLRKDLTPLGKVADSGISLLMEALRKSDISTGSANQFIEEAMNNFVAAGIIPPNTTYQQLTDPFKDLVTREAAMIANSMAKPIDYLEGRDMESMQLPNMSFDTPDRGRVELPMIILRGKEGDESMIRRSTSTQDPTMYNVADGGIIGLKKGGMNDMMDADSLMFKDPSDEGEWEYNV